MKGLLKPALGFEVSVQQNIRQVRASFTDNTIRVYQAYSPAIAIPAVQAQRFVPPFSLDRMTWIKPSFLWMMYRSGWGNKPGQERILAVDILRSGFEWSLANACLSHFDPLLYASRDDWLRIMERSPIRVQFDPDRSPHLEPLDRRAIQIGLSGEAVQRFVHHWIVKITDLTDFVHELHAMVQDGRQELYEPLLPLETLYPVPAELAARLGISSQRLT